MSLQHIQKGGWFVTRMDGGLHTLLLVTAALALATLVAGVADWLWPRLSATATWPALCLGLSTSCVLAGIDYFGMVNRVNLSLVVGPVAAVCWLAVLIRLGAVVRGPVLVTLGTAVGLSLLWQADHAATTLAPPPLPRQDLLVTDAGNPVLCFVTAEPNPWIELAARRSEHEFSGRLLPVASPHVSYSCHGWTFAEGRCHIPSDEVEKILHDNGYRRVEPPRVGDVIVYLDDQDRIIHSGVVRYRDKSGLVLVESKWDLLGRYLHRPENQPYSSRFAYYRSPRQNHTLRGTERLPRREDRPLRGISSPLRPFSRKRN